MLAKTDLCIEMKKYMSLTSKEKGHKSSLKEYLKNIELDKYYNLI